MGRRWKLAAGGATMLRARTQTSLLRARPLNLKERELEKVLISLQALPFESRLLLSSFDRRGMRKGIGILLIGAVKAGKIFFDQDVQVEVR